MRSAWWANCFTGYWPGIQFWKQCKEIPLLSTWLFVISTPWLLSVHQLHWPDCEMLLWHSSHLQAGSICMTISVTGLNLGQFETNIFNNLRKIHFVIWGKYILIFSTGRNCMTISVTGLNLSQYETNIFCNLRQIHSHHLHWPQLHDNQCDRIKSELIWDKYI